MKRGSTAGVTMTLSDVWMDIHDREVKVGVCRSYACRYLLVDLIEKVVGDQQRHNLVRGRPSTCV